MTEPINSADIPSEVPPGFEANLTELLRIAERQHLDCSPRIASVDQKLVLALGAQAAVLLKGAEQSWSWGDPCLVILFCLVGMSTLGFAGWAFMAKKWKETPELRRFRSAHAAKSALEFSDQLLANYTDCVSENNRRLRRKVRWLNVSLVTLFLSILLLGTEMYQVRGAKDESNQSGSEQQGEGREPVKAPTSSTPSTSGH